MNNQNFHFKHFILLILILTIAAKGYSQVDVRISVGAGFENLITPDHSAAHEIKDGYGNIGAQISLSGAIKVGKNSALRMNLVYAPSKGIPYSQAFFADFIDTYSYESVKSSLSINRSFRNVSIGLGFSISEVFSRRYRYVERGWMPSKNCTMLGGVFTLGYRFNQFSINGVYRIERYAKLPTGCSAISGIRAIEFGLGYFLTKQ